MTVASFQTEDWPRFDAERWSEPIATSDSEVLAVTRRLGALAEPLGFDSIWVGEHFGSPYSLWPDATQTLAYWAGRTERVDVGSCVVVLPWHNPVRLAHRIAMLDNLLEGRHFTLGVGRGVSQREYEAIGVDRSEARERFQEVWDVLKLALTNERISYDGRFYQVPETSIRPRPLHDDLLTTAACAFSTPESMQMAAEQGFSQLFVTGAPLDQISQSVDLYNATRAANGIGPDQPTVLLWMYCSTDESALERANTWFVQYGQEANLHYEFTKPGSFEGVKGYEAYATMARERLTQTAGATTGQGAANVMTASQPIGTPDQIIERLRYLQSQTGAKEVTLVTHFGGMSEAEAAASMRLCAAEVLPTIQADAARPRSVPVSIR